MTQEIIEMARDSGMELYGLGKDRARFVHHLEAFAKLVAEKALADHAMQEVQRLGQEIEQEPVAWLDGPHLVVRSDMRDRLNYKGPWVDLGRAIPDKWTPILYTTPPQRNPLTGEQISAIGSKIFPSTWNIRHLEFARAIEAAHGIKETK